MNPLQRDWWHPPDGVTRATGITQTMRLALKHVAWTEPVRLSEVPHPRRIIPLARLGYVRLDAGIVTLTEEGRAALATVKKLAETR